ncbi:hypothetical protein TNCV_1618341 [Trichonephila clavipes]|nr:hypothetical protein TNCV_1618341 [Trichonephila clavipes]
MPYPDSNSSPNGTAVSVTNHYTGWGRGGYWDSGSVERKPGKKVVQEPRQPEDRPFLVMARYNRDTTASLSCELNNRVSRGTVTS